MDICGNIYVTKDIKLFSLRCTLCEKAVQEWKDFVCHIQGFHSFVEDEDEEVLDNFNEVWIAEEIKKETVAIQKEQTIQKQEFLMENEDDYNDIECRSWPMEEECSMPTSPKISEAETRENRKSSKNDQNIDNSSNKIDLEDTITEVVAEISKLNPTFYIRSPSTTQFIELYKDSPCLWKPDDVNYQNSPVRLQAQQKIIEKMNQNFNIILTQRSLKGAIMKIRRQYHTTLEMKNKSKAKINAVVQEHFDKCSFLSVFDNNPEDITIESNTMKYLVFEKVNKITIAFIDVYACYPTLYNPKHDDYTTHTARRQAYEEMAKTLKTQHNVIYTEGELHKHVYNLKQWYYKTLERLKTDKHDDEAEIPAQTEAEQVYMEKMRNFMPPKMIKQKLACEICGKAFYSETTLQVHMCKEHYIGEAPYKCADCDRRFEQKSALMSHRQRSHMEKAHTCEHCHRRFAVLVDKQRHLLTHTGERPFICELCGKAFANKSRLGYHTVAIHTKVRAFKCTMCPKDFKKQGDLRDHIKSHLNIRDKICKTCGKGFTNCHSLIRHRQIHSEVKKFACKLCDAKFHQFVGLNSHMKRTHNIVKSKAKT